MEKLPRRGRVNVATEAGHFCRGRAVEGDCRLRTYLDIQVSLAEPIDRTIGEITVGDPIQISQPRGLPDGGDRFVKRLGE